MSNLPASLRTFLDTLGIACVLTSNPERAVWRPSHDGEDPPF